jgi:hypothetical protein
MHAIRNPLEESHSYFLARLQDSAQANLRQQGRKGQLDEMRDEGWVRDRTLYMLKAEKEKKKDEDEDVEMAEGEEIKA